MKLLLIGAGYVGMAFLSFLQDQPYEVFITTTKKERVNVLKPYGKHVLYLEPNHDGIYDELVNACDVIVVLVAPKHSQNYEETYLNTAKKISSSLKQRLNPVYIIYTSSTSVCEGLRGEWITEEMDCHPHSENAKILLETEQCLLNCNAETCILRLGGIYGPQRELIDRARRFSGKEINGSGDEPTNHIHLNDIVSALTFCLDHRLKGVYHLVNDDHPTRKELYGSLCQSLHIPLPIWNSSPLVSDRGGYKISNKKIKEAGFTFTQSFTY